MGDDKPKIGIYEGMPPAPSTEMSRDQQTFWIVGTLIALAGGALLVWLSQPDSRYPECSRFQAMTHSSCVVDAAVRRLNGGLLPSDLEGIGILEDDAEADVGQAARAAAEAAEEVEGAESEESVP
jgi:hypothetical protein